MSCCVCVCVLYTLGKFIIKKEESSKRPDDQNSSVQFEKKSTHGHLRSNTRTQIQLQRLSKESYESSVRQLLACQAKLAG